MTLIFSISFATLILMLIGVLIPTLIATGTIPVLIYYGLQMISSSMFLFTAALVCAIVSLATGVCETNLFKYIKSMLYTTISEFQLLF